MKTIKDFRGSWMLLSLGHLSSLMYRRLLWSGPARGAARDDSDIGMVMLTDHPQRYLDDPEWTERFGFVEKHRTEDYGKLTSLRVWYKDGAEVEYGITI